MPRPPVLEVSFRSAPISACLLGLLAVSAHAQCTQWTAFGAGVANTVLTVAGHPNGNVFAGGLFTSAGSGAASRIARWDGNAWSGLGAGVDGPARSIAVLPNGDLVVGGDFANAGGLPASRIARWDGVAWSPLGAGVSSPNPHSIYEVVVMPNGDVVAGGFFRFAGGVPANAIARWNGSTWSPLGSGILASVFALLPLPNGDLLVGGNFSTAGGISAGRIALWNGSTWSQFGGGITGARVDHLVRMPNGDIVASGDFTAAGGVPANRIARWNGSTWSAFDSGMNLAVKTMVPMPNGDLLAGGLFTTAGGLATNGFARWDGSAWAGFTFSGMTSVDAATTMGNGDVVIGGLFATAGGIAASCVARFASTCPASASTTGVGCPGSGGANTLAAANKPWLGSTWQGQGTGLPTNALAVVVTGFATTALPLATLLPPSGPSCTLLVAPEVVDIAVPIGGALSTQLDIPPVPGLVGLAVHRQLVLLEIDPVTFALVDTSASNRLTLTIGSF